MNKVFKLEVTRQSASTDLTLAWSDLKSSLPTKALQGHASSSVLKCPAGTTEEGTAPKMLAGGEQRGG